MASQRVNGLADNIFVVFSCRFMMEEGGKKFTEREE